MINLTGASFIIFFIIGILFLISNLFENKEKKNEIVKKHNFSGNQKSDLTTYYSPKENINDIKENTHNKKTCKIYFSQKSKTILKLTSLDYLYYISVYNFDLILLKEFETGLKTTSDDAEITFQTIELNGSETIIIGYGNRDGINYFQFDFSGKNIYHKLFPKKGEIFLVYHNTTEFTAIYLEDFTYSPITTFWTEDTTTFKIDLQEGDLYPEKEWGEYEYIESLIKTNRVNQFSFICHHANYGVQGIKIFELDKSNSLNLLYDFDNLELKGAFHNLAFNSDGSKFTVLLYQGNESMKDSFSIYEYSANPDIKQPLKIIKTEYGYWEYYKLYTHYLTDELLCVVRNNDILIFDLELEIVKDVYKRDFRSPFHIDFNVVLYTNNNKIERRVLY